MTLRVLFFSVLQDVVGRTEVDCDLGDAQSVTVSDLLGHLFERYPELARWKESLLISADLEYVRPEDIVRPGQEIAIMPPVQGG